MLDSQTKHKIDALRDTLVGVLPVPTQQVEQITLALLFKFMDDLDERNVTLGGDRQFFTGKYRQYAWHVIMDAKLPGAERVIRYGEALEKMALNPNLPELFIHIFQRAYLPFRNAQTLNLFLQQIDDFKYEHSEDLGDAFEYLLKVMGSQGDAGQFRTPRHIIDFIIAAVEPTKEMRILDPACGTAGFLISAYKHILDQFKDEKGRPGAKLSSPDKKKLAKQISGYDISGDMVRLALVNMYLHGIPEPKISEYDTLSSEARWNEKAECIFANPPFMSPKGGITPHSKFGIKSNRSEVLFVDYIAEHLTIDGRAGIIVPEGIIFQSGIAYKKLRQMLVDEYGLFAVVSLPAGIFQPYSGVKTSILLLDKTIVKNEKYGNNILFIKIENDGFDLGAQRRPSAKNDLPDALKFILAYKSSQKKDAALPQNILVTPKAKIANSGDYNLSMDRYRETASNIDQKFSLVMLGDIFIIERGGSPRPIHDFITDDPKGVNWIKIGDGVQGSKYISETKEKIKPEGVKKSRMVYEGDIILSNSMSFGRPYIMKTSGCIHDGWLVLRPKKENISRDYLYYILSSDFIYEKFKLSATGGVVNNLNAQLVRDIAIPLPPLSVQEELVAELERYRKIAEGARAIVANYKPEIEIDPSWEMKELGHVSKIIMGQSPPGESYNQEGKGVPLINGPVEFGPDSFSKTIVRQFTTKPTKYCEEGDLILCVRGSTTGRINIAGFKACIGRGVAAIRAKENQTYINYVIESLRQKMYSLGTGSTFPNISMDVISTLKIPFPPITIQEEIVARLESERAEIEMAKRLIARMEEKIKAKVAGLWGN